METNNSSQKINTGQQTDILQRKLAKKKKHEWRERVTSRSSEKHNESSRKTSKSTHLTHISNKAPHGPHKDANAVHIRTNTPGATCSMPVKCMGNCPNTQMGTCLENERRNPKHAERGQNAPQMHNETLNVPKQKQRPRNA